MKRLMSLKIIGCILFLSLMLYPNNSLIHYSEGNIFTGFFTEPVEISYAVFYDGHIFKFTSYEDYRIDLIYGEFKALLNKKGRKVKDIAIKIHNHLPGGSWNFSDGDLKFMRAMREDGFEGGYCILTPGGKIRYQRDEHIALIQFLKKKETKKFLKKFRKEFPRAYKELVAFLGEIKNAK